MTSRYFLARPFCATGALNDEPDFLALPIVTPQASDLNVAGQYICGSGPRTHESGLLAEMFEHPHGSNSPNNEAII